VGADAAMTVPVEKKLLVLDMNGLLVETLHLADKRPKDPPPDGKTSNNKFVYKRPFCNQFIEFCFQNFVVGIWSSAQQQNVDKLVDLIFGDLKEKLLFCWYQTDCTDTGLRLPENRRKPFFLKELSKLWNKVKPDLPWEEGQYGPSNTLMIDDSPYKALCNPPHTAVFPDPYEAANKQDDILGCSLRKYLEGLSTASNVQEYVNRHPFGQPAISINSQNWHFYCQVLPTKKPLENHYSGEKLSMSTSPSTMPGKHVQGNSQLRDNMSKSLLVTSIDQHSVSDMGIEKNSVADSKEKEKGISHLATYIDQQTVHGMEKEENGLLERVVIYQAALSEKHKSHNLPKEDKKAGLCSDHALQSESVLKKGPSFSKRKKKWKSHLATCFYQQMVHELIHWREKKRKFCLAT